jgi:hypothetical protein
VRFFVTFRPRPGRSGEGHSFIGTRFATSVVSEIPQLRTALADGVCSAEGKQK